MTKEHAYHRSKNEIEQQRKVFLNGLPPETTRDEIENIFSTFGEVKDISIIKKKGNKWLGFVVFSNEESAKRAIEKGDISVRGLNVRLFDQTLKLRSKLSWPYPKSRSSTSISRDKNSLLTQSP